MSPYGVLDLRAPLPFLRSVSSGCSFRSHSAPTNATQSHSSLLSSLFLSFLLALLHTSCPPAGIVLLLHILSVHCEARLYRGMELTAVSLSLTRLQGLLALNLRLLGLDLEQMEAKHHAPFGRQDPSRQQHSFYSPFIQHFSPLLYICQ